MRRRVPAFTLLEVLLATALLAGLAAAVFAFVFNLMDRRATLRDVAGDSGLAVRVVDRIEDDLQVAIAGAEKLGAGVRGTTTAIEILSMGVAPPEGEETAGDLLRAAFRWDPATGEFWARRGVAAGGSAGEEELLSDRVRWVQFRYLDQGRWRTSFDALRDRRLPGGVQVAIWMGEVEPSEEDAFGPGARGREREPAASAGPDGVREEEPGFAEMERTAVEPPAGPPDRVRTILIPDAAEAGWSGAIGGGG